MPPPIHVPPESQNVNLFRNKLFASVISYRSGGEILDLGQAKNLMTGVLKEEMEAQTHRGGTR